MPLEQAAEAAKVAAELEGYDAGLTPDPRHMFSAFSLADSGRFCVAEDVAARAGRLAYDKVLGGGPSERC